MKRLALVVAVVVAVLAVGLSSAVATSLVTSAMIKDFTIKNADLATGSVNSRVAANGSLGANDLSAPARTSLGQLWAVVNADGTLARARGATASAWLEVDGQYEVLFGQDVSNCSYFATIGGATSTATGDQGQVSVAPRVGKTNGVFVQTFDLVTAAEANLAFHLAVFC
jgi:hypothetical protein